MLVLLFQRFLVPFVPNFLWFSAHGLDGEFAQAVRKYDAVLGGKRSADQDCQKEETCRIAADPVP